MKHLILLLVFFINNAFAQNIAWPTPKIPERTRLVSIAENIKHNGLRMQVYQGQSINAPNAVYNKFSSLWRTQYSEVKEVTFDQKRILSVHLHKGFSEYLLVLEEAENQGQKTAYLSVISLSPQQHPAELIAHHLPPNSTILNDTFAQDQAILSRTIVAESPLSKQHLEFKIAERLLSDNWVQIKPLTSSSTEIKPKILEFKHKNQTVLIAIEQHQSTRITMVYTQ